MPDDVAKNKGVSLGRYYNQTQSRVDTWNQLKNITLRLVEGRERPDDFAKCKVLLDELAPFETYWAFPGNRISNNSTPCLKHAISAHWAAPYRASSAP